MEAVYGLSRGGRGSDDVAAKRFLLAKTSVGTDKYSSYVTIEDDPSTNGERCCISKGVKYFEITLVSFVLFILI